MDWSLLNSIVYGLDNRNTEGTGVSSSDGALPRRQEDPYTTGGGVLVDIKGIDTSTIGYDTGSQFDA